MDSHMSDDDAEETWEEAESEGEPISCLFCAQQVQQFSLALDHMKESHGFDLVLLKRTHQMDIYSFICLINYIRAKRPTSAKEIMASSEPFWHIDEFLRPSDFDSWLTFDFDGFEGATLEQQEASTETIEIPLQEYKALKRTIDKLTEELNEKNELLQLAAENIEVMKRGYHALMEKEEDCVIPPIAAGENADNGYFGTYAHFGIHHSMLSDSVRTVSYKKAIEENRTLIEGKVAMDLGCGTAILSMFLSRLADAQMVVAIDQSEIIYKAMEIVQSNKVENIHFVKGRIEDIKQLPVEKVDIIVSEWMGYFLMFEGMLDSLIFARKNYLKEGGLLLPNRTKIFISGYGDVARHKEYVQFWEDVYGFDMTCMQQECLSEVMVETCADEFVLTSSVAIADFDLMTVEMDYSNFQSDFELIVTKKGQLTSLVGYFDTIFELPNMVAFSTSPKSDITHWKQVVFFFKETHDVEEGDLIKGKFICRRSRNDLRGLEITIKIFEKILHFTLE